MIELLTKINEEYFKMPNLMTIKEASVWASKYLNKNVTASNISYLIQYGRIPKIGDNGSTCVSVNDLKEYYNDNNDTRENLWKKKFGNDLNWDLSFSQYKESETTKHVHRLHSYKGKFIPQLVEYFLDNHTDNFKKQVFFNKNDIILDPFCGSGTTLVQANELGINSVGIDISAFNAFISNMKIGKHNIASIENSIELITNKLEDFQKKKNNVQFEIELLEKLKPFNAKYFPSPAFKYKVRYNEINELEYGKLKSKEFLKTYNKLIKKYKISLKQDAQSSFLDKWFLKVIRDEIEFVFKEIKNIKDEDTRHLLALVLSRTVRSCRATTHADLATLKEPIIKTYYCKKHGKICKPIFSIMNWWKRYTQDTINRILEFNELRTDTSQRCLIGDSRTINIVKELKERDKDFAKLIKDKRINGIFSSPPYVGLIDYHEQHAYAYDLMGFERRDKLEIGPLYNGQGVEARKSYVKGISEVLLNCKKYLTNDYDVFLVANDKYGLYPEIAKLANMKIINEYKRPVLNRVEKDRSAYAEIIFHLKEQ